MCDIKNDIKNRYGIKTIPVTEAIGTVLAHDITEIRQGEFKGRAFKKGLVVRAEDIEHLKRLGKENLFVLKIEDDEMHEDDAAYAIANAHMGRGVRIEGAPKEGKINIIADRDGILKINKDALTILNMAGDIMCATLHDNTVVRKGQLVAGTRAIPLLVKKSKIEEAVRVASNARDLIEVKEIRSPNVGVVITGNEVYYGRIKDAFAPIIRKKLDDFNSKIVGICYAPDDEDFIEARLRELINAGADLLITTGGMSVDPDDVTRFAIERLGANDIAYGSAVIPGAMFLIAYLENSIEQRSTIATEYKEEKNSSKTTTNHNCSNELIPVLGIPACCMYHKTTIFDLILPRVLAGEKIGRTELAELGHGGLCLNCKECRYPICPFGK